MPNLYIPTVNTFDYDDIILVPKQGVVKSRSEVAVTTRLGSHEFALPIIPANMSTIVDEDTCVWLAQRGIFYVMHRFAIDAVAFTIRMQARGLLASVSLGIKPVDYAMVDTFATEVVTPDYITVDVAHGDSAEVFAMVRYVKQKLPNAYVIAGNLATIEGTQRLVDAGANAVKIGIGPGCFAAGTRILMADASYKNIESVKVGDRVINKEGNAVTVVGTRNSGLRLVQEYKHTSWYQSSYATADHQHFGIDIEGLRSTTFADEGYAKIAQKNKKVSGFPSRTQWLELNNSNLGALLFPRNIKFEMPVNFEIDLTEFSQRKTSVEGLNLTLRPSYNLGYIFGTFLGDGNAKIPLKSRENGALSWAFGKNEMSIALKLQKALKEVSGKEVKIWDSNQKNILILQMNSTIWSRFMHSFGKKNEKHLPAQLLVNNKPYLQGLYDGLLDSDGHVSKSGREVFTNTSSKLIELFSLLTLFIKGAIPNQMIHGINGGNLKNVNVANLNQSYRTELNLSYESRLTPDFYAVKITQKPKDFAVVETYDIEVDCPTHSFIANNVIVHNSACLTAPNTGFGSQNWQLSAVAHVAEYLKDSPVQVIADGGIRKYGDIAKSIAFGADMVMIGGMFAGHDENPGEILEVDGEFKKAFFGSASEHQKGEQKHVEGKKMLVPYKGSLETTLQIIKENLQSSVSYAGGTQLHDLTTVTYVLLHR